MITVTRFDNTELIVNADLIEFVETLPDTHLTLVTGKRLLVRETAQEVVARVLAYRRAAGPLAAPARDRRTRRLRRRPIGNRDGLSDNHRPRALLGRVLRLHRHGGRRPEGLINPSAALLVFGGTLGASMIGFPLSSLTGLTGVVKNAFLGHKEDLTETSSRRW